MTVCSVTVKVPLVKTVPSLYTHLRPRFPGRGPPQLDMTALVRIKRPASFTTLTIQQPDRDLCYAKNMYE